MVANAIVQTVGQGGDERTMVVANFADTNWADDNNSTTTAQRVDRFPGSILDFVFVAGDARNWRSSSRTIIRTDDFPDTADTSDHRPVEATLDPDGH